MVKPRLWLALCACVCAGGVGCAGSPPGAGGGWFAGAFSRNPNQRSPQLELAWGRMQERDGNLTEARASYAAVLQVDPGSVDATLGLARLDFLANRMEEAERGYKRAVQLSPHSPQARNALGQFYAEQERWEEAMESLAIAVQAAPNERVYRFHYAVALTKANRLPEAVAEFTQAVGPAEAHYNIGRLLYDMGNIAAAEEEFAAAVLQNPRLEQAQVWLDEIRHSREPKAMLSQGGEASSHPDAPTAPQRVVSAPMATMTTPAVAATLPASAGPAGAVQASGFELPTVLPAPQTVTPEQLEQMRNQVSGN